MKQCLGFVLAFFALGLLWPQLAHGQDSEVKILARHNYELHSSSTTGVAPQSGRKYNYVVSSDCRLNERQAKGYSAALADSLYEVSGLDKAVVFLYLDGMDPASVAYAKAKVANGSVVEQDFAEYLLYSHEKWKNAPVCDW